MVDLAGLMLPRIDVSRGLRDRPSGSSESMRRSLAGLRVSPACDSSPSTSHKPPAIARQNISLTLNTHKHHYRARDSLYHQPHKIRKSKDITAQDVDSRLVYVDTLCLDTTWTACDGDMDMDMDYAKQMLMGILLFSLGHARPAWARQQAR